MPACRLDNDTLYLHVPKTGGTWISNVLLRANAVRWQPRRNQAHITRYEVRPHRFTFCFVRHPVHWYESLWRHRQVRPIRRDFILDVYTDRPYTAFLEAVIEHVPGFCGWYFEQFAGPPDDEVEFVGRFEALRFDLACALDMAGVEMPDGMIQAVPPMNQTPYPVGPVPGSLCQALCDSEKDAMDRWNYS